MTAALLSVTAISPERALRLESTALTIIGVFHILAPLFMLRASFMSGVSSATSAAFPTGIEQLAAGGSDGLAIIGVLVSTLQAIGSAQTDAEQTLIEASRCSCCLPVRSFVSASPWPAAACTC